MSARVVQHHQRGQAAIEALLIVIFGFTLVLAIHHLAQLRSETLDLLGESHFLSFVPTQKLEDQKFSARTLSLSAQNLSTVPAHHSRFNGAYAILPVDGSPYGVQQREIENQLGFDSTTLLRASAQSAIGLRSSLRSPGLSEPALLVRHSFLLSGSGQAESTLAAQTQIAGSTALWQKSFARSRPLVSASSMAFHNVDLPWDRPALTADWLLPWADESLVK